MVARIWRTGVKPERFGEYERFARERSLPMFLEQRGFIGVLFMREEEDTDLAPKVVTIDGRNR